VWQYAHRACEIDLAVGQINIANISESVEGEG
jgi:hypothetical protein